MAGSTTQIEDDAQYDEAGDRDDLYGCKDELAFSVDTYRRTKLADGKDQLLYYSPAPNMLMMMTTTRHIDIQAALLTKTILDGLIHEKKRRRVDLPV